MNVLSKENFSDKIVTGIVVSHGICGSKIDFQEGDYRRNFEDALKFQAFAGGKFFKLFFEDGTDASWHWDMIAQAYMLNND